MSVNRLIAAAAVLVALTVITVTMTLLSPESETPDAAPPPTPETTSTAPDFAAIVEAETLTAPLSEQEETLTEMVLSAVDQTTVPESTTTTTAPPTTSTTQRQASQPKTTQAPSSPATTAPPATSPPSTVAAGFQSGAEGEFGSLINSRRSAAGLASLSRDGSLDSHARAWAQRMAERGSISHSNIGSLLPPWSFVGENVGSGGSVGAIFKALTGSSAHDANIKGDYTHVGIGVWRDGQGRLWTAHVFAR